MPPLPPPRNVLFALSLPDGVQSGHIAFWAPPWLPHRAGMTLAEFKLLYLLSGTGAYEDESGTAAPLGAGAFLLRPPGLRHGIVRDAGSAWLEFALTLPGSLYRPLVALGMIPAARCLWNVPPSEAMVMRLESLVEAAQRLDRFSQPRFLHDLQKLFVDACGPGREGSVPAAFLEAKAILAADLQQPLTMPEVARRVRLGYHAFRKGFVRHFGVPPKEYRIRCTIERAQDLLADPERDLWAVADALGYPDPPTFSRQFKRVTGLSPSAFRRGE